MSRNEKPTGDTHSSPGPVPMPPPNRRSSFSQNPSFSTLFGGGGSRGSPPRTSPDFQRRFSWSYPPPKESSAIDDTDEPTSPTTDRRDSELGLGRRLSTTASSIREALGLKFDEPTSPRAMKTNPFQQSKPGDPASVSSTGTSPASSEGGDIPAAGRMGTQSFIQRRRASFGKSRKENDPQADRMLQGHFSID